MSITLALALALAFSDPPSGHYDGAIDIPGAALAIDADWSERDGALTGDLSIPQQGAKDLPLVGVKQDGAKIEFRLDGVPGDPTFDGEVSSDAATIRGKFTQGGQSFPFHLERLGSGAKSAREALATFAADLDAARAAFDVPGCAVVVVSHDEVVFAGGCGLRDVEGKKPVTSQTLFAIGSSTKAFTTLLLATLVDERKLDWDQPVRTWLPEFRMHDAVATDRMTPRDLVTHRSGLPRHDLMWYGIPTSREDIVKALQYLEPSKDFRTDFQYNNLMYVTAGVLAQRVGGAAWEDLVTKRILEPLGMKRVNFSVHRSQEDADFAKPYARKEGAVATIPFRDIGNVGPAGSINACVDDLAPWLRLQLSDGTIDGKRIVSSAALADLHEPRIPLPPSDGKDLRGVGYALGWFVDEYRGYRRVQHGGNIDGFSALVCLVPSEKIGVAVLTNCNATGLPERAARLAIDRLVGLKTEPWMEQTHAALLIGDRAEATAKETKDAGRHEGTSPAHPLDEYVGDYEHPAYGRISIAHDGDALACIFHAVRSPLAHYHFETFELGKGEPDALLEGARLLFRTDVDGDVVAIEMALEPAVDPIVFRRQSDAKLKDPKYLAAFAGEYALAGKVVKVALEGDKLVTTVPGQPPYELAPLRNDRFELKALKGFKLRFRRDASGAVTSAIFEQPDGTFVAERKPAQ